MYQTGFYVFKVPTFFRFSIFIASFVFVMCLHHFFNLEQLDTRGHREKLLSGWASWILPYSILLPVIEEETLEIQGQSPVWVFFFFLLHINFCLCSSTRLFTVCVKDSAFV